MHAYVGITDLKWYEFLAQQTDLDEVNFWQPSGKALFKAIRPGELFLFKLHSPLNFIVGGGIFAASSLLPINLAWETFGPLNGAGSYTEMHHKISAYLKKPDSPVANFTIGCIVLVQPFFLPQNRWIAVPEWNSNIVKGKTVDLSLDPWFSVWKKIHEPEPVIAPIHEDHAGFGVPKLISPRLGQGAFRVLVTDTYLRRCAVTGERTLPALEAAHIIPYSESGQHIINNGLLLRRDLHALFDQGYVTVNPDMQFEVSKKIKEEFDNGRDYYALNGKSIFLPADPSCRPDKRALDWHNCNRFKG